MTFPVALTDVPSSQNYPNVQTAPAQRGWGRREPVKNQDYTLHSEGINVGYRYFNTAGVEVSYPFGFGLSYTTFEYGEAKVSGSHKSMKLTVPVTNTGGIDGEEIVQVYVKSLDDPDAPIKSLKGFKRVTIEAGKTVTVSFDITPEMLQCFGAQNSWSVEPGDFTVMVGSSSADEDLKSALLTVR